MAGVDKVIKHYRVNHDTGERTLNTDFNIFVILNGIAFIANLILILTVGAFGQVTSTTKLLSYTFQSLVTVDELFFQLAWSFLIPWQGFWAIWQIVKPSERNCEGVVRAAYFYPLAVGLYAGYTISCRMGMLVLGCIFCYGMCATLVGLAISMQKYRAKIWKGYFIWQGPLTLHAAIIMIETMLMTNLLFVKLDETWLIKTIIAGVSLLVIFITAIAWLSSYPVDLLIPFVLACAILGMYIELKTVGHFGDLFRQGYSNTMLEGWRYAVLAILGLITLMFIIKLIVILLYHRPKDQEERTKRKQNRVSISITIDRDANKNNKKKKSRNNNHRDRHNDRQSHNSRRAPEYEDDYYGNNYDNESGPAHHYDDNVYNDDLYGNYTNSSNYTGGDNYTSPPSTPKPKKKKKKPRVDGRDRSNKSSTESSSPSPKKKKSSRSKSNSPKKSPKKKKASVNRSPAAETSATSIDDDDSMV